MKDSGGTAADCAFPNTEFTTYPSFGGYFVDFPDKDPQYQTNQAPYLTLYDGDDYPNSPFMRVYTAPTTCSARARCRPAQSKLGRSARRGVHAADCSTTWTFLYVLDALVTDHDNLVPDYDKAFRDLEDQASNPDVNILVFWYSNGLSSRPTGYYQLKTAGHGRGAAEVHLGQGLHPGRRRSLPAHRTRSCNFIQWGSPSRRRRTSP